MPTRLRDLTHLTRQRLVFAFGTFGLLLGHWAAETGYHWLVHEPWHDPPWEFGAAAFGGFALCAFMVYLLREAFTRPETWIPHGDKPPDLPVLIWFLSPPTGTADGEWLPDWFAPGDRIADDVPRLDTLKTGQKPWNGEMLIRAAAHHAKRLRVVVLVVSHKSAPFARHVAGVFARYGQPKGVRVLVVTNGPAGAELGELAAGGVRPEQGWDFENFQELGKAVTVAVERLNHGRVPGEPKLGKFRDTDIMVDFTGGQKVTSVVAATVTFNRHIRAEYVSTDGTTDPPHQLRGYDLRLEPPEPPDHGHGH